MIGLCPTAAATQVVHLSLVVASSDTPCPSAPSPSGIFLSVVDLGEHYPQPGLNHLLRRDRGPKTLPPQGVWENPEGK
jgi:hypothetical protein